MSRNDRTQCVSFNVAEIPGKQLGLFFPSSSAVDSFSTGSLSAAFDLRYVVTSSYNNFIASVTPSLFTASYDARYASIVAGQSVSTSSLTGTFDLRYVSSASFNIFTASVNSFTSSLTSSLDLRYVTTSSYGVFTSSHNSFTASLIGYGSFTASHNVFTSSVNTFTASVTPSLFTASYDTRYALIAGGSVTSLTGALDLRYVSTASYGSFTASQNVFVSSVNVFTASVTPSLFTASYDGRYAAIAGGQTAPLTGALDLRYASTASFNLFTASLTSSLDLRYVSTASYGPFTSSQNVFTSSVNVFTASLNVFTSSHNTFTSSINVFTASVTPSLFTASYDGRYASTSSFSSSIVLYNTASVPPATASFGRLYAGPDSNLYYLNTTASYQITPNRVPLPIQFIAGSTMSANQTAITFKFAGQTTLAFEHKFILSSSLALFYASAVGSNPTAGSASFSVTKNGIAVYTSPFISSTVVKASASFAPGVIVFAGGVSDYLQITYTTSAGFVSPGGFAVSTWIYN